MGEMTPEALVERSLAGDRAALDALVRAIQDDVYGLALRMLWVPADAADATQEILVQIITHLSAFRGESSFRTWCFRIASNALLRAKSRRQPVLEPVDDAPAPVLTTPEDRLLEREVRVQCSLGLLQTLDAEHRLAYVVGEVLGLPGDDAAEVTGVEPATYRKRLSRARERMREFLTASCGVVNDAAKCRCSKHVRKLDGRERVFTKHLPHVTPSLLEHAQRLAATHASTALYRELPDSAAPETLRAALTHLLNP